MLLYTTHQDQLKTAATILSNKHRPLIFNISDSILYYYTSHEE